TGVVPGPASENVAAVIVAGSIAVLKSTEILRLIATPVVPSGRTVAFTSEAVRAGVLPTRAGAAASPPHPASEAARRTVPTSFDSLCMFTFRDGPGEGSSRAHPEGSAWTFPAGT